MRENVSSCLCQTIEEKKKTLVSAVNNTAFDTMSLLLDSRIGIIILVFAPVFRQQRISIHEG